MSRSFHPATFIVTGLIWLFLSTAVGCALLLADAHGIGLSLDLRQVHGHAALVGGAIQIIMGLWFIPIAGERPRADSRPGIYFAINFGTVGMLLGFGIGQPLLVGAFSVLAIGAMLALFKHIPSHAALNIPRGLTRWWYGTALTALSLGLALGEGMAWKLVPHEHLGWVKVAHAHLTVVGFMLLALIGLTYWLLPAITESLQFHAVWTRIIWLVMPLGAIILAFGLAASSFVSQISGGILLMLGVGLYACDLARQRIRDEYGRFPRAVPLLRIAGGYLGITALSGIALAVNALWLPPPVRIGQWHLLAYAHLFYLGFAVHHLFGLLTGLLPLVLAKARSRSHKKRKPIHAELIALMERGTSIQLGILNLGIMGLVAMASLVWWVPLKSPLIPVAAWTSAALLLIPWPLFLFNAIVVLRTPARP
ncbi:MAG: hypothetical protein D6690_08610 [Nitrospirae bacterium]|nr:MAG: hypothetical protein D6690_08610 [Nitrospirota bacterium]